MSMLKLKNRNLLCDEGTKIGMAKLYVKQGAFSLVFV